jgi:hypothetical protein
MRAICNRVFCASVRGRLQERKNKSRTFDELVKIRGVETTNNIVREERIPATREKVLQKITAVTWRSNTSVTAN